MWLTASIPDKNVWNKNASSGEAFLFTGFVPVAVADSADPEHR